MTIQIRQATAQDCDLILEFISGLAEYEQLSHEVVATADKLNDTLFGTNSIAHVVIAELDGVPAGFALYFYNYSTFLAQNGLYLEDLFVLPSYRGQKIGKALLIHLAQTAVAQGCGRFEWSVLDWNQPAIDFYRAMGAVGMDGWTVQRVTGSALQALAQQQVK
ncbi:MAG: GNAT family N-acetyltransferase [Gammaproteobacteria bacterium]|nr:GNAT family N-acetyltransferase [Gammaproteobacteria bacterium]NVK86670.1 GNAT family N-acetyltransferase [Gammaproteobacteria bacterium]